MNIYLRKILKHDITHQISVTKEVLNNFFGVFNEKESATMRGKKSGYSGTVTFLLATDPRFGGDIKQIINSEGGMYESDILLFVKGQDSYTIEIISRTEARHNAFISLMETERHLIVHIDDINGIDNVGKIDDKSASKSKISQFPKNRIIFGAPGTGKSFNLKNDCEALLRHTSGSYERVTFHPDYTYSHFVGTYKPVTDIEGNIRYQYVPGPFMRVYVDALKSSKTDKPQPHLLLIEEINRAKVAAVFGDVFQLLDRDDEGISEFEIHASEDIRNHLAEKLDGYPSDFDRIRIPDNMFIWATMNSADQGVFPMDTAFKRRWHFEYLGINHKADLIKGKINLGKGTHELEVDYNRLRKAINEKLTKDYKVNEDKLLGPFFLSKRVLKTNEKDGTIADPTKFIDSFKSKIIMYLYEDAAKQHKHKLFDGCDSSKFSSVCEAFDEIGIDIFGNGFRELYDQQEV